MTADPRKVHKRNILRRWNESRRQTRDFEERIALCAAELKRVNRLLRLFNAFGRVMENAIHDLLHGIQRANQNSGVSRISNKGLTELQARYHSLTPRERDVMQLVVEGLLNKEIAAELGTAEVTVKIQRGSAMKKMKASSVADLVRMSERIKAGITSRIARSRKSANDDFVGKGCRKSGNESKRQRSRKGRFQQNETESIEQS